MNSLRKTLLISSFVVCSTPGVATAGLLDLATSPLYTSGSSAPNVFFMLDDSGSMDWEILTPKYWHHCSYDSHASGSYSSDTTCGFVVDSGVARGYANSNYRDLHYIFVTNDNAYNDSCSSSSYNSAGACSNFIDTDWRIYSSDLNLIYYNPSSTYIPWAGSCLSNGNACDDASFQNAKSNPKQGSAGYSMTRNLTGSSYEVWIDDKGYSGDRPLRSGSVNATTGANDEVDLWDSHVRITFTSGGFEIRSITYAPNSGSINKTVTLQATLNGNSGCYNVLGSKELVTKIFNGELAYNSVNAEGCRTRAAARTNFANWYEYHRRRSLLTKAAIGNVISSTTGYRFGLSVINNHGSFFKQVPSSSITDYESHNNDILSSLYGYTWQALGTPLRQGLEIAGKYLDGDLSGKTDPIINSCQQNFTVLLTDGYWNGNDPASAIGNADGDGYSKTVADVAKYYYNKDLSSFANIVPPNEFDSATHQHMVTYGVAFGVTGNLVDTDNDGWPNPMLSGNGDWGNPYSDNAAKIDDVWHAAYNSKGAFLNASTPEQLNEKLSETFNNIEARIGSATAVAQDSTVLSADSKFFQARYNSDNWNGDLLAFQLLSNKKISTEANWSAACKLNGGACNNPIISAQDNPGKAWNQRVIISAAFSNNNTAAGFNWPANLLSTLLGGSGLTDALKALLKDAPNNLLSLLPLNILGNEAYASSLIKYLRGDASQEQKNNGSHSFRNRSSKLADIVNSAPVFVGRPRNIYPDDLENGKYSTFATTYANRKAMVYVGSNDGMVHGFDANTGEELLAFIPSNRSMLEKLADFAQQDYSHNYIVDGKITATDAYVNNNWRSILIGGLGAGGQGIYALDVTNPNNFSEANANSIYLWEFDDSDDAELGYTYSDIKIAKININGTNKWAAVFANGYNNSENDGYSSNTGKAHLFVLIIDGGLDGSWTEGVDYFKIPIGSGSTNTPNGLASPFLVDNDGDYIVDYAYAGDLKGDLWKFDFTGGVTSDWASKASKLFSAKYSASGDQPITSAPIVKAHPTGVDNGFMIYFGTGKFLEISDNNQQGQTTQTFYGIWDQNGDTPVSFTHTNLLQQKILSEHTNTFSLSGGGTSLVEARISTNYAIDWDANATGAEGKHMGWYLNLIVDGSGNNQGERVIFEPLLRNNKIIFTTLIPSPNPCSAGGESWLMELNAENGGRLNSSPFDLNRDGEFTEKDLIDIGNNVDQVASGIKTNVGITATPTVALAEDKQSEVKVLSGSGGIDSVTENPAPQPTGRQSWRQLR